MAVLIVCPVLLVGGVEGLQRGSAGGVLSWAAAAPFSFALNTVIVFFAVLFAYCLAGSLFAGLSVTALLLSVMSLVSYYKMKLIGEPLFPWDLFLKKEGMNIIPLVAGTSALYKLGAVAAFALLILFLRLVLPSFKLPLVYRAVFAGLAFFMLYSLACKPAWTGSLADRMGIADIVWNQSENYGTNGVILAFTMNVQDSVVPRPAGYGQKQLEALAARFGSGVPAAPAVQTVSASKPQPLRQQPNIIFIMNEAFWDPTLLPDVKFSVDPVPTVHELEQTSTHGYLLSPQFGGGTSNVEFEVLTGNSMSFLPSGSVPYQQYVNRATPSLASYFEDQGYKSMGIHSYEGWFWNRTNVYKDLGFEGFMSKEYFDNPEYKGLFISDDEVSRSIIRQVDESDRPMFIYAVTMQNHGPYDGNRYGSNPIKAEGPLTDDARSLLETYTHGAHDADQSLKMLIDHFSKSEKPTVIVFYGDHLPMLGYDYDVYHQGGLIRSGNSEEWSLGELKRMHSVPFVAWSNFGLEKTEVPVISDSFLGSYVLNMLQMPMPAQFLMDYELYGKMPGMLKNLVVDSGLGLHGQVPDGLKADVDQYRLLQYDMLFGKQYAELSADRSFPDKYPLQNFNREFADIRIHEVQKESSGTDPLTLTVKGENFYSGDFVLVNGRKLAPSKVEEDTIEVTVPKEVYDNKDTLLVQVEQLNSKSIPLSKSNTVTVTFS